MCCRGRSIIINALGSSIAPVVNSFVLVVLVILVYAVLGVQARACYASESARPRDPATGWW